MLESLLSFFKTLFHTTKKEDVLKVTEFGFNNLVDNVIPALNEVIEKTDINKSKEAPFVMNICRIAGIKAKDASDGMVKIKAGLEEIAKERNTFIALVTSELSNVITDKTITAKDTTILRIVNDINAMNSFVLDFIYMLIVDKATTDLPAIKLKNIHDDSFSFAEAFKVYANPKFAIMLKDIKEVSTASLDFKEHINDGNESMLNLMLSKTGKTINLPVAKGFINNPIYHVRMWLIDREIEKYESLKDKKRLIELRVMELSLKEKGENDPALKKQIEYYENELSKLEYTIAKIESK